MRQTQRRRPAREREEAPVETVEAPPAADLAATDALLEEIDATLDPKTVDEVIEELRGQWTVFRFDPEDWPLVPDVEVRAEMPMKDFRMEYRAEFWSTGGRRQGHGDDGLCRRCGWPAAGPPGPGCLTPQERYRPHDPKALGRITNV